MAKPFLRWVGGKGKFTKEFASAIKLLSHNKTYIEPFLGGGAMFFAVQPERAILNDINLELMATYEALKLSAENVHEELEGVIECGTDEETYYLMRDFDCESGYQEAARFIYLNRTCFNGLYRVNASGKFNVPYGKLKKPYFPSLEDLLKIEMALHNIVMHCECAIDIIMGASTNDFLYVDPPYDGTHSSYNESGFDEHKQIDLALALQRASLRGAKFIAHNTDTELVRECYSGWTTVMPFDESHAVAADGAKRGKVSCVLITNL